MDGQETQELHLKDPESNLLTVSVPCGQGFFVTMYAANRVGVSPQTSLTVPADDKGRIYFTLCQLIRFVCLLFGHGTTRPSHYY